MIQAKRQITLTEGGAEKIFEGAQINFSVKLRSEDQEKVFIPNCAPCIRAICLLLGHNFRSEGGEGTRS